MISEDEIIEICKGCAEYRDIGGVRYCGINYPEHGGMCRKHLAAQEARTRREVLEEVKDVKAALEEMVWQFTYHGIKDNKPVLHTGGLSALEYAFSALGWSDPHYIPEEGNTCEVIGCLRGIAAGTHWGDLYLHLCSEHTKEAFNNKPRPSIKPYALSREAQRGKDGILPTELLREARKER